MDSLSSRILVLMLRTFNSSLYLSIIIISGAVFISCFEQTKDKKAAPEYLIRVINYFDSNRLKEYDTVSFGKRTSWGSNYWRISDSKHVSYEYYIGFPDRVDSGYQFPVVDSLERIWISNLEVFNKTFASNINIREKNIDVILNKHGLVDWKISWRNKDSDQKIDLQNRSIKSNVVFSKQSPFDYFRSRTKIMDSLGVEGISSHSTGNFITIKVRSEPEQEYLDYLPNNLMIDENYKHIFDSVIAKGSRINKNWVWRKYKKS